MLTFLIYIFVYVIIFYHLSTSIKFLFLALMNHCIYICHMSKFQLEILKGSQDVVNLMSNTLQTNFHSNVLSSVSD